MQETALAQARLQAETARTCGQLRLFAQVAEEGSWVNARIDHADPDRKPAPKPDIRSMLRPLGRVVVFGASNFPLAFSVAGGDTASALAAGNTVIVKAHAAHPGTGELVGRRAGEHSRMRTPRGRVLHALRQRLANRHCPDETPSRQSRWLYRITRCGQDIDGPGGVSAGADSVLCGDEQHKSRIHMPRALRGQAENLAAGLHASFTLGAGQFCRKPGMVFLPRAPSADLFSSKLCQLVSASAPYHLLTKAIHSSYRSAIAARKADGSVTLLAEAPNAAADGYAVNSAIFEADAVSFLDSDLDAEIFGPSTLLVRHSSREQLLEIARSLDGHLTATIHGSEEDLRDFADLIAILENKVGRMVFNGFPTGVEVTHAMVHGGPYPSTSDGRCTSVGSQAIFRFTRLVCYQGFPDSALPDELKDPNPLGIWRMIDGQIVHP